jgi:hypothetical protein
MKKIAFLIFLLVGCKSESAPVTLRCQNCNRAIYEGPMIHYSNGFVWPAGHINHCKAWDINCVSVDEYRVEFDKRHKTHWGYEAGRKDALEFRYHEEFDSKVYHHWYVEGYKKGYKEVIEVRRAGTSKEEENEP